MAPLNIFRALTLSARNVQRSINVVSKRQVSSENLVNLKRPQPPARYKLAPRRVTMEDLMEPYGSWKEAYAKDNRQGNLALIKGFVTLSLTLVIFFESGITDELMMPNLDNIIADTDQYKEEMYGIDKSDRRTL